MKKRMVLWLTCILTMLGCATAFSAQHVIDDAGLFTTDEITQMESTISDIADTWQMDTLILTTDDTGGIAAREYGAEYFLDGNYGYGDQKDGVVFVIDMGNRDAQMVTHGAAIDIFTDYYIESIWDEVSPHLSDGDYFEAMTLFLQDVDFYCQEYQNYLANPETYVSEYQKEQENSSRNLFMIAALVVSIIIAAVSIFVMRASHNNVKPFTDGQAYLKNNGVHMRINQDSFVSTHTTRTPIPKNDDDNSSSWGGGSSTFSSGGSDFGGGGGKF